MGALGKPNPDASLVAASGGTPPPSRSDAARGAQLAAIEGESSDPESSMVGRGVGALLAEELTAPRVKGTGKRPRPSDGMTELLMGRKGKRNATETSAARDSSPEGPVFPNLEVARAGANEFPPIAQPPLESSSASELAHLTELHAQLMQERQEILAGNAKIQEHLAAREEEVRKLRTELAMPERLAQLQSGMATIKSDIRWLVSNFNVPGFDDSPSNTAADLTPAPM